MPSERLSWIDWMKTIAMYLIIAGHCSVPGNKYIYVFSVPCFFILSGFLSKVENESKLFWKKLFWNLIVPTVILWTINTLIQFIGQIHRGSFYMSYLYQAPVLSLLGMQGENYSAGGLKALWFVYTLIICKVILQYLPKKWNTTFTLLMLSLVFLFAAYLIHSKGIVKFNSVINVFLAMPFFTIGYLLRPKKERLSHITTFQSVLIFCIGLIGIWICGTYNDIVMLYRCSYGSSLLLCILGGICGTAVVYSLSWLLGSHLSRFTRIIGGGTIIILGLHVVLMLALDSWLHLDGYWLYLEALVILLVFYPVIIFSQKYIPVVYGMYRN